MEEKGKQATGRAVPASAPATETAPAPRPGGGEGSRAGPPRAPLTGEAAAPLAVPAAPLQDEVAAALLGHPELQRVLEQHLLGLEPHRGDPAAPAGPRFTSPRPPAAPGRARSEGGGGRCARGTSSRSAETKARLAHPALPAVGPPRLSPAPTKPRPSPRSHASVRPRGSSGASLVSSSQPLPGRVPEWREEIVTVARSPPSGLGCESLFPGRKRAVA